MAASSRGEFRRGWPVVLAAFLGMMFSIATVQANTLGVLTPYLVETFGWTRTQVQTNFAVMVGTFFVASPIAGLLATKFGARRVVLTSMPLLGVTFALFGFSNGSLTQFYLFGLLSALVGAGTLPMGFARVVTAWFPSQTGLALALALLGPGVLQVISVPIVLSIADNLGWRAVYFIGGCMPFVMYPLVWRWLRPPPEELKAQHKVAEAAEGLTLREALRSYRFWVMGSALGLAASCVTGAFTNLPTLLADAGLTKPQIMATAPVLGLSMLAGRVAGGRLLDRFWAPAVALVFLLSLSAGLLVLSQDTVALPLAVAALVLVGVSSGVEYDLMAYMVSRYFGLKAYAAIYGALFMFTGAGGGLAPIFLSAAHDLTGSFQVVLVGASGLIVLAGAALLTLGRYSFLQQREAQPSGTELPAQTAHQP